jgi:hypothetical protein
LQENFYRNGGRGECCHQGVTINRVHDVGVIQNGAHFIALQLSDEVPRQVERTKLERFWHRILMAILTDVVHTKRRQIADQGCRMEFRDHDRRDLGEVPFRLAGGVGHPCTNPLEPLTE